MKVLHVLNSAAVGGGPVHVETLIRHSPPDLEHHVAISPDGPMLERLRQSARSVQAIDFMASRLSGKSARALRAHVESLRPDIVHLHGTRAALAGVRACRKLDPKPGLVYTVHARADLVPAPWPVSWLRKRSERYVCRRVDKVICVSPKDLAALDWRGDLKSGQGIWIPNAVDPPQAPPGARERLRAEWEAGWGWTREHFVVGTVARLVHQKGIDLLIEAAARAMPEAPHLRFAVAGDGPLRAKLQAMIDRAGIANRFKLLGHRDDVPAFLAAIDAFCLPSRWECQPLALLEAEAMGVPVVKADGFPAGPGLPAAGQRTGMVPSSCMASWVLLTYA